MRAVHRIIPGPSVGYRTDRRLGKWAEFPTLLMWEWVLNPDDILLWPDGFWCLREEFRKEFLRGDNYRVILRDTDEWLRYYTRPPALENSPT
jgi:hypothetical protein